MKVCSKCGVEKPLDQFYPRYAQCKACTVAVRKAYYEANRDEARAKANARYAKFRERNPDKVAAAIKRWRQANPDKVAATMKRWQQANPDKVAAHAARHRAAKLRATPPWLTPEQQAQMAAVYAQARRLQELVGGEVHVDHIVPLNGRNVRGLHVPWNLRPLDGRENRSKGNR